MKKLLTKENIIKFITVFYMASLFLDMHIFYNSASTLIRMIIFTILFLIVFIKFSNKQERKILIIYFILVGLYFVFHHINALHFKSLVPNNFNYSLISELLYIWKMLLNVYIIYIVYQLGIKLNDIKKIIRLSLLIITGSIVITNLLKISYSAYDFNLIKTNIFGWFDQNYTFLETGSKGFFHLTNQIVAMLLLYTPIELYLLIKENKKIDYLLIALTLLCSLMIGTRLSVYGIVLEIIAFALIYSFFCIIKKEKFYYKRISIIIMLTGLSCLIIPVSPITKRTNYYDNVYTQNDIKVETPESKTISEEKTKEDILKEHLIDPNFYLNSYPYKYDEEYWDNIILLPVEQSGNARFMELSMVKRVVEINNNKYDSLFGITYTRIMNIFNIEQDYIMQYYSLGIIGSILLLSIYLLTVLYSLFKIIKNLDFKNIVILMSVVIYLLSAYFSGNILNAASTIIPISFILGILVNEVNQK